MLSRTGRRVTGRNCWVRYAPLAGPDSHVGYAIGRSVGSAVVRNRIRRRLRAIVAGEVTDERPGLYLFGVKNDSPATMCYESLRSDVVELLAGLDHGLRAPRARS